MDNSLPDNLLFDLHVHVAWVVETSAPVNSEVMGLNVIISSTLAIQRAIVGPGRFSLEVTVSFYNIIC